MEKVELSRKRDEKSNSLVVVKTIANIDDFIETIGVFKDKPYYEILDKDACEEEYALYEKNGLVLGAYVDGKIAGVNCLVYDSDKSHSIVFPDDSHVVYYSGLAVKNEYRRFGLGKLLVGDTEKFLEDFKLNDYHYARILCKGSMSEGIFAKNGFVDAYDNQDQLIVDDVEYLRNNSDVPYSDKRKYMVKSLTRKPDERFKRR